MPPEGISPRRHDDILSYEELVRFTEIAVELGITKVRITGGEPLVRRGSVGFVRTLAGLRGVSDLSLTTNGVLLPRYAAGLREAGLRRVNVSVDSLDPARYERITRRGTLRDALRGLDAALEAGFDPVKVNAVLLEGIENELDEFLRLAREAPVHVRFIEFMPVDRRHVDGHPLVAAGAILEELRRRADLEMIEGPYGHGPAVYWREPQARGTIGFIAGVSDHFCRTCNRLRLTADGRLRTCLFSGAELDVRPLLDRPADLRAAVAGALDTKAYDRDAELLGNERSMSQIGG
jgi:cyclic pyranopterin phosphate synthase